MSVNGRTGVVTLNSTLISAASAVHSHVASDITNLTNVANVVSVNGRTGAVNISAADVTAASSTHGHSYVQSLNALTGTPSIVAGSNVTVTTGANSITIASGAGIGNVTSVNGRTGTVVLTATDVSAASSTHTHGYVQALNALTGTLSIVGGNNVTVTTASSSITIASVAGSQGPPGSFGDSQSLSDITASYTLAAADAGKMLLVNSSSATTITVPANADASIAVGTHIDLARIGSGTVTVAGGSGVTVNATPGLKLRARYSTGTLIKIGTNSWLLVGDIST